MDQKFCILALFASWNEYLIKHFLLFKVFVLFQNFIKKPFVIYSQHELLLLEYLEGTKAFFK